MILTAVPPSLNFLSSVIMAAPLGARGRDSKEKPQQGSASKTGTRAQSLLSSASQSLLNLTSKKLTSRQPSSSGPVIQKKSKQLAGSVSRPVNSISGKPTAPTSKQNVGKDTVEKVVEPSVKRKVPAIESSSSVDKRKSQKSELKQNIVKKTAVNDNSSAKNTRLLKKSSGTCERQIKSSVIPKKKESKLCFSYSSHRKKNVKEKTVETKDLSNKEVEKSVTENQNHKSDAHLDFEEQKLHENLNDDVQHTAKECSASTVTKHSSIDEQSPRKREKKGRLGNPNVKSDSELYGDAHLKSILKVLRSNLSPEAKLSAIKSSHDYWKKFENGNIEWDQVDKLIKFSMSAEVDKKKHTNVEAGHNEIELEGHSTDDNLDDSIAVKHSSEVKSSSTNTSLHVNANLSGELSEQSVGLSAEVLNEILAPPASHSAVDPFAAGGIQTILSVDVMDENHHTVRGTAPPKSPVTVQEWVNSIDLDTDERVVTSSKLAAHGQSSLVTSPMCENPAENDLPSPVNMQDGGVEDNLTLGAEAHNLEGVHHYVAGRGSSDVSPSTLSPKTNKITLGDLHFKQNSFNSETSGVSGISSISSVESLLESRKEDPEEILLALGFGGKQIYDPVSRIPQRFLSSPSSLRGITVEGFLQQQEDLMQRQDNSCLGYLGLSVSPHNDGQPSSALANRILDKLEDSERKQRKFSSGSSTSLQDIVSVMRAANAFRTGKMRHSSDSILDPANREFLEKQGKIDPLERAKKLILGMHTYSFDQEGGLVQSSESENEESVSPSPRNSKWKKMYKRLEDHTSCVDEVDEENLKSIPDCLEDKTLPAQQDESKPKETKLKKEPMRFTKKRPLICRQSRIDDDNELAVTSKSDMDSTFQHTSKSSKHTSDSPLKQHLKPSTFQPDKNKRQSSSHLLTKDSQCKDSFELDELSPAEGLENETGNVTTSWSEAEAPVPCNFSDSSGFAEDAASESTCVVEHTKKHNKGTPVSKSREASFEQKELIGIKVPEKKSDDSSDDCDETTVQEHDNSTEFSDQGSTVVQHSKKLSKLKRAHSFVQGHNNSTTFFAAISDQRRHSATTPGEMIFTQLKRGSSIWHLHPPLLWNNLSDLSYMSSSEATLTSHQSTEKICEDSSDSLPETKKSSPLFISTKNIWLSNEKTEPNKSNFSNKASNNYFSPVKEDPVTSVMGEEFCKNNTGSSTNSSLLSDGAIHQPLSKTEIPCSFDKLLVDCLFSKLNNLRSDVSDSIRSFSGEHINRNSNSWSLTQLREGLLTQITSIENILLHESQENAMCESVVHAAQEMIDLISQQHAACVKLEHASEERSVFDTSDAEKSIKSFSEWRQEDGL